MLGPGRIGSRRERHPAPHPSIFLLVAALACFPFTQKVSANDGSQHPAFLFSIGSGDLLPSHFCYDGKEQLAAADGAEDGFVSLLPNAHAEPTRVSTAFDSALPAARVVPMTRTSTSSTSLSGRESSRASSVHRF